MASASRNFACINFHNRRREKDAGPLENQQNKLQREEMQTESLKNGCQNAGNNGCGMKTEDWDIAASGCDFKGIP